MYGGLCLRAVSQSHTTEEYHCEYYDSTSIHSSSFSRDQNLGCGGLALLARGPSSAGNVHSPQGHCECNHCSLIRMDGPRAPADPQDGHSALGLKKQPLSVGDGGRRENLPVCHFQFQTNEHKPRILVRALTVAGLLPTQFRKENQTVIT